MTTPADDNRGWTDTPGLVAGSRNYTHPQYAGWKIYDAGAGGVFTIYRDGVQVATATMLPAAINEITENFPPDNRRVDLEGNLIQPVTVDPTRPIPADEIKALVTIETVERGTRLAIQIIGGALDGPIAEAPAKLDRAVLLLSHLAGVTSNRTCTAVKDQDLSDRIAAEAREHLAQLNAAIDAQIAKGS